MSTHDDTLLTPETSVDFKMFGVYQGLACAFGCCHQNRDGLLVEFEIRGLFGLIRSNLRNVTYSYAEIESLKVEQIAGYATIVLKLRTLEAASRLPVRNGRELRLAIDGKDTLQARELSSVIELRLSQQALQERSGSFRSTQAATPVLPGGDEASASQ